MKPTLQQLTQLLDGNEPSRGGYSSEFQYEELDNGVEVTFLAEWLPRNLELVVVVTNVEGDNLTYYSGGVQYTETVEEFCEGTCGEYGC